jgi:hypothetical protein
MFSHDRRPLHMVNQKHRYGQSQFIQAMLLKKLGLWVWPGPFHFKYPQLPKQVHRVGSRPFQVRDSDGGSPEDSPSVLKLRMMGAPWGANFTRGPLLKENTTSIRHASSHLSSGNATNKGECYYACFKRHSSSGGPHESVFS